MFSLINQEFSIKILFPSFESECKDRIILDIVKGGDEKK